MSDNENKKINVAWICGSYFISHDILTKILNKYHDAEIISIDAENTFQDLYISLATKSMFYACKLVIIKDMPEATDAEKKRLISLLDKLPHSVLCVFYMLDSTKHRSLYKVAEKIGKVYENIEKVNVHEASAYIEQRFKLYKKTIENEALEIFLNNLQLVDNGKCVGTDNIEQYIRKINIFIGEKDCVSVDDVVINSQSCDNYIVWNLLRELDSKKYEHALNMFSESSRTNKSAVGALHEMLNILLWKYRMLLCLKDCMASGLSQQESIQKTSQIRKIVYEGVGLSSVASGATAQTGANKGSALTIWSAHVCNQACNSVYNKKPQIECYSRKELYVILECLNDCMYLTRTCELESEAILIADIIIGTICSFEYAQDYRSILKRLEESRRKYA